MYHNSTDTHLPSQASHWINLYQWLPMTWKSWKLIVFLTPNGDTGCSITLFTGPDTDMGIQFGSQRKTSRMVRSLWKNSIATILGSHDSGQNGPIGFFFFFLSFFLSSIGCSPVQMASARVLPPLDHSQVEVQFPCAQYLQDNCGICFLFFCLSFLFICRYAAQEVCGLRGDNVMART